MYKATTGSRDWSALNCTRVSGFKSLHIQSGGKNDHWLALIFNKMLLTHRHTDTQASAARHDIFKIKKRPFVK